MHDSMKQDALAWLDLQRDAVNTEIIYATQDEKKQYHDHLKIINWVAEAARIHGGEMTAEEYLRAKTEMCKAHAGGYGDTDCLHCPAVDCRVAEKHHPRRAVEVVKKWKEERDGH